MSKTKIVLILFVVAIGVVIGIFTNFNPIAIAQEVVRNPAVVVDWIKATPQLIMANLGKIATGLTGVGATFTVLNMAYTRLKKSKEQVETALETQTSKVLQLETEKKQLEKKVTKLTQAPQFAIPQKQFNDVVSGYETKIESMRNQFGMERNMLEKEINDLKEVKIKLKDGKVFVE